MAALYPPLPATIPIPLAHRQDASLATAALRLQAQHPFRG